jgi:hypothetical protein
MIDDIETALRDELRGQLVPLDPARANEMIRVATMAPPRPALRPWGPALAAAAVVAVGGGVAALATQGNGAHSGPVADGSTPAAPPSATTQSTATRSTASTPGPSHFYPAVAFTLTPDAAPGSTASADGTAIATDRRLAITSMILQNPNADRGEIQVLRVLPDGSTVNVLHMKLSDFRDLDHIFDPPVVFASATKPRVTVTCDNTAQPCTAQVLMAGHYERP